MNFFQKNSKVIVAFVFACAVIFVYKTFDNLGNIFESIGTVLKAFTPFFIGFVIAYILNMPSKKFAGIFKKSKKAFLNTHSYGIGVACSYVLAIVLVVIAISAVIPALSKNIIEIYNIINLGSKVTHKSAGNDTCQFNNQRVSNTRCKVFFICYCLSISSDVAC